MSRGRVRVVAGSLLGVWLILSVVGTSLALAHGDLFDAFLWVGLVAIAAAGAILAVRVPSNPIGWLLLVGALLVALSVALEGYAATSDDPASLPGGRIAVWFGSWLHFVWLTLLALAVPLLFPGGRLSSRRGGALLLTGAGFAAVAIAGAAFGNGLMEWDSDTDVRNPLLLPGAVGDALDVAATVGELLFALALLAGAGALVLRLRRARGVERQQLKWFALAGSVMLVGLVAAGGGETVGAPAVVGNVGFALFLLGLVVGLPVSMAIAILRYRLYDIDVVIRRTVVYGALTLMLAGAYLACILLLQLVLSPDSDLAIAGSTLAVAALVRPAKSRIQAVVDRRFYRRRYDAAVTLEGFGTRVRDEIDLESLGAELRAIVSETVQPSQVSLWLR